MRADLRRELEERIVTASSCEVRAVVARETARLSDQDLVDAVITCSCCGEKEVDIELAVALASRATSVGQFYAALDRERRTGP